MMMIMMMTMMKMMMMINISFLSAAALQLLTESDEPLVAVQGLALAAG